MLAVALELWVMPSLGYAVRRLEGGLPAHAAELSCEYYRVNTVRNLRFRHQLVEAVHALNAAGIVPLLFKGALQLVDGSAVSPGNRGMADLDLLVPRDQGQAASKALRGIGYTPEPGKPFLHPHELPFFRRRDPGPIELHVELGSPPIPTVLPAGEAWADSSELSVGDAIARALSPTHQVLHNILHSAVQDLDHAVGALPLRQLLTLSHLVRTHGAAVDWTAIRRRMEAHDLGGELRDHLWLAHRFAGMALPDGRWRSRPRLHEVRVLASFGLGWPSHLQRNVRQAFARPYLDALYAHGNHPLKLASARARHAIHVLHRDGRGALRVALERRA